MLHDRISFTPAYKQTRRRVLKVVLFANADAFEKAVSIWRPVGVVDRPCGGRGGGRGGAREGRIYHCEENKGSDEDISRT